MGCTSFISGYGTHARMKANERAATYRNSWRGACHHVMVTSPMITLIVTHRTHNRILIGDAGQFWKMLANLNARDMGRDRLELTSYFSWCLRLGQHLWQQDISSSRWAGELGIWATAGNSFHHRHTVR